MSFSLLPKQTDSMNVTKINNDTIFDITKVIYTDMKANFDYNFIG